MKKMKVIIPVAAMLLAALFPSQNVFAQYSSLSFDAKLGTSYSMASVTSLPGGSASLALHYSPMQLMSVSADLGVGMLLGAGTAKSPMLDGNQQVSNKILAEAYTFQTGYYSWGGSAHFNLHKLIYPKKRADRIIPYIYGGMGMLRTRSMSEAVDRDHKAVYHYTYITSYAGAEIKMRGTRNFDYIMSIQQNFTETAFLDAIPAMGRNDGFLTISVGVAYQIGFKKSRTHVDWAGKCYCPSYNF